MKSYLIRDKTISPEKDFNTTLESFDNNRNGPGITVYVIENKGIYSGNKQFLKDFSYNSGIPTRIPIKAGKQYLLFQELDYCGASICAL